MEWSRTKVKRLTEIFIGQGWCEIKQEKDYSNLIFKNTLKIQQHTNQHKFRSHKYNTLFLRKFTAEEIFIQLNSLLLHIKIKQHQFVRDIARDLTIPDGIASYKRAIKVSRNLRRQITSEIASPNKIAFYSYGRFLRRHYSTAKRRLSLLIKEKIIYYHKNYKHILSNVSLPFFINFRRMNPQLVGLVLKDNCIKQRIANSYYLGKEQEARKREQAGKLVSK